MADKVVLPTIPFLLQDPNRPYIHRDLSWLQFNDRVLAEATDKKNPLLERLKFIAITASNLDEFFMIRIASMIRELNQSGSGKATKVLAHLLGKVDLFQERQKSAFQALRLELSKQGVHICTLAELSTKRIEESAQKLFSEHVLPLLPEVEKMTNSAGTRSFNFLENLQMALIFEREKESDLWLRVPKKLPLVLTSLHEGSIRVFFLDDLLIHFCPRFLHEKKAPILFRVTRDADFSIDVLPDEASSLPLKIKSNIQSRNRGRVTRIQLRVGKSLAGTPSQLQALSTRYRVPRNQIYVYNQSLCFHGLWKVTRELEAGEPIQWQSRETLVAKNLSYPTFRPYMPPEFKHESKIFAAIETKDFLLHHPYDSFDAYIHWIRAACADPHVTEIYQTIYRMDTLSPVLEALKFAAKTKKVVVVIELRARFDEMNNLQLTDDLTAAGVKVHFGFGRLKLHAKAALIRRVRDGMTDFFSHLSTGNYHAVTARAYTDLGLFTYNQDLGKDLLHFFDAVLDKRAPSTFRHVSPAPTKLHKKLLSLIQQESLAASQGKPSHIIVKVNALVDPVVIDSLYLASQMGTRIDLIVRGPCSLIPGIKGLSENIRVVSIVDRYLEHSRIYYFAASKALYLSSADFMPRNFFSRLELAFPILDPHLFSYVREVILETKLKDNVKARELNAKGQWNLPKSSGKPPLRSQIVFERLAEDGYKGIQLEEK